MTIKMTKTLPSELGYYFYKQNRFAHVEIVFVDSNGIAYFNLRSESKSGIIERGGYWAKVESEHFEFEGLKV